MTKFDKYFCTSGKFLKKRSKKAFLGTFWKISTKKLRSQRVRQRVESLRGKSVLPPKSATVMYEDQVYLVCYGLISLHVNLHNNRLVGKVFLVVKSCRWGKGKMAKILISSLII